MVNHIKIIKNPAVNTPKQTYIRYFGPKAFQGDSAFLPRPISQRATEDEDTSIPNVPSSVSTVYGFGHNSFSNKGHHIDAHHSFGIPHKASENHKTKDNNTNKKQNREEEEEFEEELMEEIKVKEPNKI